MIYDRTRIQISSTHPTLFFILSSRGKSRLSLGKIRKTKHYEDWCMRAEYNTVIILRTVCNLPRENFGAVILCVWITCSLSSFLEKVIYAVKKYQNVYHVSDNEWYVSWRFVSSRQYTIISFKLCTLAYTSFRVLLYDYLRTFSEIYDFTWLYKDWAHNLLWLK